MVIYIYINLVSAIHRAIVKDLAPTQDKISNYKNTAQNGEIGNQGERANKRDRNIIIMQSCLEKKIRTT